MWFKKNKVHVIVWLSLGLLVIVSPLVYRMHIQRNSPLPQFEGALPQVTTDARMYVDALREVDETEHLYRLQGWGFLTEPVNLAPDDYERSVLLVSDQHVFALPASSVPRADVAAVFKDLGLNLKNAGYSVSFNIEALPQARYSIALLFTLPDGTQARLDSKFVLDRTANTAVISLGED